MDASETDEEKWSTVVVQFPVAGVETEEEEGHRGRVQKLLDEALAADDNGSDVGEDINSETANLFLDVRDANRAVATAPEVLRRVNFLDGVVIAVTTDHG